MLRPILLLCGSRRLLCCSSSLLLLLLVVVSPCGVSTRKELKSSVVVVLLLILLLAVAILWGKICSSNNDQNLFSPRIFVRVALITICLLRDFLAVLFNCDFTIVEDIVLSK